MAARTPARHPPQTSHQAKKAYQKSNNIFRFSDVELRRIERSEHLRQRAERLKEREKLKRANQKKKAAKEEKERAERRKKGQPERDEGYISPRQVRIGVFFEGKDSRKQMVETFSHRDEEFEADGFFETVEEFEMNQESIVQIYSTSRTPLQEVNSNQVVKITTPTKLSPAKAPLLPIEDDWAAMIASNTQIERELSDEEVLVQPANPSPSKKQALQSHTTESGHDDTTDLIAYLSTQDLYSFDDDISELEPILRVNSTQAFVASLSTQELEAFENEESESELTLPIISPQELDLTEDNLMELMADLIPSSPVALKNSLKAPKNRISAGSFGWDDAEISSQDLRALVP
ncbi:hypothetical protein MMC06_004242 [Schaereria dolodes]|nr:hypothetical protein [Schaereria dolodes]